MTDTPSNKRQHDDSGSRSELPSKRIKCDFDDTITLLVGDKRQRFVVHRELLCAKSKFFSDTCSASWNPGAECLAELPTATPEEFQLYTEWIYSSGICVDTLADTPMKRQVVLMEMYIIGGFFDDRELRNAAMECLIINLSQCNGLPTAKCVAKIYETTPASSPLRRFLMKWFTCRASRADLKKNISDFPSEFVGELAMGLMERVVALNEKDTVAPMREMFKPEVDTA